ncbi:hypothetical protein SAMN04488505_107249 [Chitinophaga rupis]|uniref:Alginate lyase n=1 Tax=Chitinophaga rupis TaxID=573321 RepID=A0A1H8CWD0_9BACT|nr:hypothetical protein [Chitinophaga rupis]SEM99511.1 hypothetical protein SAMN04488505_107249 [Chitinophaga rupis]
MKTYSNCKHASQLAMPLALLVIILFTSSCKKTGETLNEDHLSPIETQKNMAASSDVTIAAAVGSGWLAYSPTKKIHLDDENGLQIFDWTSYKSVGSPICADYRSENRTETFRIVNNKSNRSEIRLQNDYSTGSRQFEGYVTFSAPLDDESLMQIFGSTNGATQLMIRGYAADGGSIKGAGQTLATNVYGKEVHINVIHLQEDKGNRIKIYINGVKKADIADNEAVTNYMKYGNYGTLRTGTATVKWRAVKVYRDGTAPN